MVPEKVQTKLKCPIYMSPEFRQPGAANKDRIGLVLIQGTGAVRAGVWARSVCVNDSLDLGSMLPQIEWAVFEKQYPVLVMNPNYNKDLATGKPIPENDTMANHALHVWKNYVANSGFKSILVIAHSKGGSCLEAIIKANSKTFYKQVKKVAITDSKFDPNLVSDIQKKFMQANAIHYKASIKDLGTPIVPKGPKVKQICPLVSAGHPKHEYTTGTSWPMI